MLSLALTILVLLLIGVLITFVVQKYVPLDGNILNVIIAIVWVVILIAIVQKLGVL